MGACLQDVLALGAHGGELARPAVIILEFYVELRSDDMFNLRYYSLSGAELVYMALFPYYVSSNFTDVLDRRVDRWVSRFVADRAPTWYWAHPS